MVSSINKAKIPIAAPKLNRFDIPECQITTSSFMRFSLAAHKHVIKRTTLKCHHDTFIRTAPLDKPFYGNVMVHDRAFFVPYRVVWEPWEDFRNNVPHNQPQGTQLLSYCPSMSASEILNALTRSVNYTFTSEVTSSALYDFSLNNHYYVFTQSGRAAVTLLESLGYKIGTYKTENPKFNCLGLLCLAKIYIDWYWPSAYGHYGRAAWLDGIFQRQVYYELNAEEIEIILGTLLYVCYDSDFYTSLWDNPVGVNPGTGSVDFEILDPTLPSLSDDNYVRVTPEGTPYVSNNDESSPLMVYSQFNDAALKALTSYVARHRLAGSRSLERALASYGVMLSAEKLRRCYYLGSNEYPLHVADVMSTAETSEASLGSYAGKAVSSSAKTFESYSDEDGMFAVINSIVPLPIYYQGIDANVEARSILDFHNGEFDGLGPVSVKGTNLFVGRSGMAATDTNTNNILNSQVFGFAPRYYHLKIPYNRITGDFAFVTTHKPRL